MKPFHKHDDKIGVLVDDWNDLGNHIGEKIWIVPHQGNGMGKYTPLKTFDRERIRQYTGLLGVIYGLNGQKMYCLYDYEIWINGDYRTRERGRTFIMDSLPLLKACQPRVEKQNG